MAGRLLRVPLMQKILGAWPWWLLLLALFGVRLSKGAGVMDAYALLSRPFWPGPAQSQWLQSAQRLDEHTRLQLLEQDNARLRGLVELDKTRGTAISAPVISRLTSGWWQQLELGKGSLQGVRDGAAVIAPGGLIGLVSSVTPTTARVALLTNSSSRLGVWIPRVKRHGLLVGLDTPRPRLEFLDKDTGVRPGDVVTTSPASTLVPPNLTVGVVQSVDEDLVPAPDASVQLSAPIDAVDWVQVVAR
ncbi:MAG: rod shape-determining protein MreC [Cyanobacteria bacterium M_surface_10_m1_298]|nr:rod shape-determining protein MreC [Cyanobacteria bacterium M_surface_10_m1_298]